MDCPTKATKPKKRRRYPKLGRAKGSMPWPQQWDLLMFYRAWRDNCSPETLAALAAKIDAFLAKAKSRVTGRAPYRRRVVEKLATMTYAEAVAWTKARSISRWSVIRAWKEWKELGLTPPRKGRKGKAPQVMRIMKYPDLKVSHVAVGGHWVPVSDDL